MRAYAVYNALKLISRLVNLGDAKSLACHPASTTHRQMPVEAQAKAGVIPEDDSPQRRHRARGRHHRRLGSGPRHRQGWHPWRVTESPMPYRRMLTVGILNNMPEAAIRSTERQLRELLSATSGHLDLRWFSFQPRRDYERVEDLWALDHLDGLIVTGTEPRAPVLSDEPYWMPFITTVEWAATHTTSTVWSCLAAHATVLPSRRH